MFIIACLLSLSLQWPGRRNALRILFALTAALPADGCAHPWHNLERYFVFVGYSASIYLIGVVLPPPSARDFAPHLHFKAFAVGGLDALFTAVNHGFGVSV